MEEKFKPGDHVVWGYAMDGIHVGWDNTIYRYVGSTSRGQHVLENLANGTVFATELIMKVGV